MQRLLYRQRDKYYKDILPSCNLDTQSSDNLKESAINPPNIRVANAIGALAKGTLKYNNKEYPVIARVSRDPRLPNVADGLALKIWTGRNKIQELMFARYPITSTKIKEWSNFIKVDPIHVINTIVGSFLLSIIGVSALNEKTVVNNVFTELPPDAKVIVELDTGSFSNYNDLVNSNKATRWNIRNVETGEIIAQLKLDAFLNDPYKAYNLKFSHRFEK